MLMEKFDVTYCLGGNFVPSDSNILQYVGGRSAVSTVETDKLSVFELKGLVGDHDKSIEATSKALRLYWQRPGCSLDDLVLLQDDSICQLIAGVAMTDRIIIYVVIANDEKEKESKEQSDPKMDQLPLPSEVETSIDDLLRQHINQELSLNFEKERDRLIELRSSLQNKNYQETKFRYWFDILGGTRVEDLPLSYGTESLSPHVMCRVADIIKIINDSGGAGSTSNNDFNDGTSPQLSGSALETTGLEQGTETVNKDTEVTAVAHTKQTPAGPEEASSSKTNHHPPSAVDPKSSEGQTLGDRARRSRGQGGAASRDIAPCYGLNAPPKGSFVVRGYNLRPRDSKDAGVRPEEAVVERRTSRNYTKVDYSGSESTRRTKKGTQRVGHVDRASGTQAVQRQNEDNRRNAIQERNALSTRRTRKGTQHVGRVNKASETQAVERQNEDNRRNAIQESKALSKRTTRKGKQHVGHVNKASKTQAVRSQNEDTTSNAIQESNAQATPHSTADEENIEQCNASVIDNTSNAIQETNAQAIPPSTADEENIEQPETQIQGNASEIDTSAGYDVTDTHWDAEDADEAAETNISLSGNDVIQSGGTHNDAAEPDSSKLEKIVIQSDTLGDEAVDEDVFEDWEFHQIKFKKDLMKETLMFDSVGRWLQENEYVCILTNPRDFVNIDGVEISYKDYLLGVVIIPLVDTPVIHSGWNITKSPIFQKGKRDCNRQQDKFNATRPQN